MSKQAEDQDFLEFVVKNLVDNPSAVKVERKVDEMGVLLTLHLDPADMGKIIGKAGSTAKAIRSLLRIVGLKNHARVTMKIEEPEGSMRREHRYEGGGHEQTVDEVVEELKL